MLSFQASYTPLHLAVLRNQSEIVNFLVDLDVDPNLSDQHGKTALHFAIQGFTEDAYECPNSGKIFANVDVPELFF